MPGGQPTLHADVELSTKICADIITKATPKSPSCAVPSEQRSGRMSEKSSSFLKHDTKQGQASNTAIETPTLIPCLGHVMESRSLKLSTFHEVTGKRQRLDRLASDHPAWNTSRDGKDGYDDDDAGGKDHHHGYTTTSAVTRTKATSQMTMTTPPAPATTTAITTKIGKSKGLNGLERRQ